MTSDVVLTAALRNNLLSLQKTQSLIDITQFRLATGRRVNSALDNPQSFFAASALNNRASDLQRLLDGLGQNIQVIKAADNGITALTKLVEQADSIATQARDTLAQGTSEAKVTGDRDLSGIDDLTTISGLANGDIITLSITDKDGVAVDIGPFDSAGVAAATVDITIDTNDSIDELLQEINNIQLDDGNGVPVGGQAFEATLDSNGQLQIRTLNGGDFNAVFVAAAGTTNSDDLAVAAALGFGEIASAVLRGDPADPTDPAEFSVEFTVVADVALRSFEFNVDDGTGNFITASRSTLLENVADEDGNPLFANIDDLDDEFIISINGGTEIALELGRDINGVVESLTIQDFVDQINNNASLNQLIEASFDEVTGRVSISPISSDVENIQLGVDTDTAGTGVTADFGFGLKTVTALTDDGFRETIQIGQAAAKLAALEDEFDNVRTQIDALVSDTGYRGVNLLNGDKLVSTFNEFRTSTLTTNGVTFNSAGLGLDEADFSREQAVDSALATVREALEAVRSFGTTLANNLSIIQTREEFTKSTINTLIEGSDKLTIADQNEEGAKLLSLQTRQQLGVTSLSLAAQSQQSILRLF